MPVASAFDGDVAVVQMAGEYTPADIRLAISTLFAAPRPRPVTGLVFDVRESSVLPRRTAKDIRAMAAFLAHVGPLYGSRLALVADTDLGFGLMRMGGADVDAAGVETMTFRTADAALAWLRGVPPAQR
jgi:hypothetical protein